MKKTCIKTLAVLLILVITLFAGCKNQYKPYSDGVYKDKYVRFTIPNDYIIAVDLTKEMGKLYKNFYNFKGEKDISGNNIVYFTMEMKEDAMKIFSASDDKIIDRLKSQYRDKDKSIIIYDFHRLEFEDYEGYFVYYGIGAFGTDIEQSEDRTACAAVTLFSKRNYTYSTIAFNSVDKECESVYLDCAKTVQPN